MNFLEMLLHGIDENTQLSRTLGTVRLPGDQSGPAGYTPPPGLDAQNPVGDLVARALGYVPANMRAGLDLGTAIGRTGGGLITTGGPQAVGQTGNPTGASDPTLFPRAFAQNPVAAVQEAQQRFHEAGQAFEGHKGLIETALNPISYIGFGLPEAALAQGAGKLPLVGGALRGLATGERAYGAALSAVGEHTVTPAAQALKQVPGISHALEILPRSRVVQQDRALGNFRQEGEPLAAAAGRSGQVFRTAFEPHAPVPPDAAAELPGLAERTIAPEALLNQEGPLGWYRNRAQQDLNNLDKIRSEAGIGAAAPRGTERPITETLDTLLGKAGATADEADALLAQLEQHVAAQGRPVMASQVVGQRGGRTQHLAAPTGETATTLDTSGQLPAALRAAQAAGTVGEVSDDLLRAAQVRFMQRRYGDTFPPTTGTKHEDNAVYQWLSREGGAAAPEAPAATAAPPVAPEAAPAAGVPVGRRRVDQELMDALQRQGVSRDEAIARATVSTEAGPAMAAEGAVAPRPLGEVPPAAAVPEAAAPGVPSVGSRQIQIKGPTTGTPYDFEYQVRSLDDLIPSHTDLLRPTPGYPAAIQGRMRDQLVSQQQTQRIAAELEPRQLLTDMGTLDAGPPIIGADRFVESGNGRILGLRRARVEHPEQWAAYQQALPQALPQYGLGPEALAGIKDPVLVRVRQTPLTPEARVTFGIEANVRNTLGQGATETGLQDARILSDDLLNRLTLEGTGTLDQRLAMAANRGFIRGFLDHIPLNDRATMTGATGELSPQGLTRIQNALFARVFPGETGQRLLYHFRESLDPGMQNIQNALFNTLPELAALAKRPEYAIADDLARATSVLERLYQEKLFVGDYIQNAAMWERELTPFQEGLLQILDQGKRKPAVLRDALRAYSEEALAQVPTTDMFTTGAAIPKEQLLDAATAKLQKQPGLFTAAEEAAPAAPAVGPRPQLAGPAAPDLAPAAAPAPAAPALGPQPPLPGVVPPSPAPPIPATDLTPRTQAPLGSEFTPPAPPPPVPPPPPDPAQQAAEQAITQARDQILAFSPVRDPQRLQTMQDTVQAALGTYEKDRALVEAAAASRTIPEGQRLHDVIGAELQAVPTDKGAQAVRDALHRYPGIDLLTATEDEAIQTAATARYARALGIEPSEQPNAWQQLLNVWRQQALLAPAYHVQNILDAGLKNLILGGNAFTDFNLPAMAKSAWQRAGSGEPMGPLAANEARKRGLAGLPNDILQGNQSSAELLHNRGLEAVSGWFGRLFRANRMLGESIEQSARAAAFFDGFDKYAAAHAEELAQTLAGHVAGDTTALMDTLRTQAGKLGPEEMRTLLEDAGLQGDALLGAFREYGAWRAGAYDAGIAEAMRRHFDYAGGQTRLDSWLRNVLAFHVFTTRNVPLYAEILTTHPGLFQAMRLYDQASERGNRAEGISERNKRYSGAFPIPGGEQLSQFLFGRNGLIYFSPLRYISIAQQLFETPLEVRDESGLAVGLNAARTAGLGINPFVQMGLNATGVMGAASPQPLLRLEPLAMNLASAAAGQPLEMPWMAAQRLRVPGTAPPPADPGIAVRLRVAENALKAGTDPYTDPGIQQAYALGPASPLWRQAARELALEGASQRGLAFGGAMGLQFRPAEQAIVAHAQLGIPETNADRIGTYGPLVPRDTAAFGAPLMAPAQRAQMLRQRALQGYPEALAFETARQVPAEAAAGEGSALHHWSHAVLAEYHSASPAKQEQMRRDPLKGAVIAVDMAQHAQLLPPSR